MRRLVLLLVVAAALVAGASGAAGWAGQVEARWVITDLGTLGGEHSQAFAVNDRGQVVGFGGTRVKSLHAFVWQDGRMQDLGISPRGFDVTLANDINERGQITVNSERIVPIGNTEGTTRSRAFVWENGRAIDLGGFGGKLTSVVAINERGQVIGSSQIRSGEAGHGFLWRQGKMTDLGAPSRPAAINDHGLIIGTYGESLSLWQDGKRTDLGPFRACYSLEAVAINEAGHVIGRCTYSAGATVPPPGGWPDRAFLLHNGKLRVLGTLGGTSSTAWALNNRSQIVGTSMTKSGQTHAFLWDRGRMVDLGPFFQTGAGGTRNLIAVNELGQIVWSTSNAGRTHAVLWDSGKRVNLGALPGATSSGATGLNNRGQTIGWSTTKNGQTHAVLWTLKQG